MAKPRTDYHTIWAHVLYATAGFFSQFKAIISFDLANAIHDEWRENHWVKSILLSLLFPLWISLVVVPIIFAYNVRSLFFRLIPLLVGGFIAIVYIAVIVKARSDRTQIDIIGLLLETYIWMGTSLIMAILGHFVMRTWRAEEDEKGRQRGELQ